MNILHHKSWHVRTKQNIERVRRDEAQAAKEEEEKKKKIALAEQETRTELLRVQSRQRLGVENPEVANGGDIQPVKKPCHINFFSGAEAGISEGTNTDREKEKREEQEKLEKNIGLLKYLDEPAETPWYLKTRTKEEIKFNKKQLTKQRSLNFLDPLTKMAEYTEEKNRHRKHNDREHHRHRSKTESNKSPTTTPHTSQSKSIEQLRAERLKREQGERLRAETLLSGSKGARVKEAAVEMDDRKRGYNSQFNPEFSRQDKHKRQRTA